MGSRRGYPGTAPVSYTHLACLPGKILGSRVGAVAETIRNFPYRRLGPVSYTHLNEGANLAGSGFPAVIGTLKLAEGATWANILYEPNRLGYKVLNGDGTHKWYAPDVYKRQVSYFGMIYIFWRLCIIKIKWCWNAYGTGYVPLPAKRRENVTGNIIVKPSVRQRFDSFMERGRVLFFSAPCGFGKTALADALLSGRDVLRLNAGAADFALPALSDGWDICLLYTSRCV